MIKNAIMLRYPDYTRTRLKQLGDRLAALIYPEKQPLNELLVSGPVGRISYADAQSLDFRAAQLGEQFGPLWATFWFRAAAQVPEKWAGREVHLLWVTYSEALLWRDGKAVQGLNYEPASAEMGARCEAPLMKNAVGGERIEFQIEMACNRLGGARGGHHLKNVSTFLLDQADIAVCDAQAWELYYDFRVLQCLLEESDKGLDKAWAGRLLSELNRFANEIDLEERATWDGAHAILKALYQNKNASYVHELSAIGHAHIDTAYLWPIAETHRKCERTFSSQVALMDEYPEYKFACSQAYQYEIIKERNPDLYRRIKEKVAAGQWIPVGGTYIEPDCNLPNGESLVRQFLFGQRFFEAEFGRRCREFWEPDVFGYNGQLPQIMRQAGMTRFLTQKLSWNRFNKPAHHTFTWQGIDGSEVLAHFPPADTYNAVAEVWELRKNAENYKDHDRSQNSLMLFGFGDGGGGPTRRMLEILRRAQDLQGLPRTQIRSSDEFFERLEADCTDLPKMVGELYFEYHRGTYTTQAAIKKGNRECEILLHDVEFLSAIALRLHGYEYPKGEIDRLWKLLLLNQFHDILPGSCIPEVVEDALRDYAEIKEVGTKLRDAAAQALVEPGDDWVPVFTTPNNGLMTARTNVGQTPDGELVFINHLGIVEQFYPNPYHPRDVHLYINQSEQPKVKVTRTDSGFVLEQGRGVRAEFLFSGELVSFRMDDLDEVREVLTAAGNVFEIYDDQPTNYDAWDVDPYHMETGKPIGPAFNAEILTEHALRVEVAFDYKIGKRSTLRQIVRLDAGSLRLEFHCKADWREEHKMLKVAFPVNVRAHFATYGAQFGYVQRPTHFNNSYDLAKYEVCGQRWADLRDHSMSVTLFTDCKYGFSTQGNVMRISLLRAPKFPDPQADIGEHEFAFAFYPFSMVAARYMLPYGDIEILSQNFNRLPLWVRGNASAGAQTTVCWGGDLILDTVKRAEDDDSLILRFYEPNCARSPQEHQCLTDVRIPFESATFCNILEDELGPVEVDEGLLFIPYTPFQIITVKLTAP